VPQRFEQNSSNLSKVETMVTFPTELDMRPYMHDAINGYVLLLLRDASLICRIAGKRASYRGRCTGISFQQSLRMKESSIMGITGPMYGADASGSSATMRKVCPLIPLFLSGCMG
jgi:hypothetical protein